MVWETYEEFDYADQRSDILKDIFTYVYDKKSVEVKAAIAHFNLNIEEDNHFAEIESIQY